MTQTTRRGFVQAAATASALSVAPIQTPPAPQTRRRTEPARARRTNGFDVAIVGSGVFGSWTALHLQSRGLRVALIDAYGPGNSRASSGGETRVTRMGYGPDEIYTRMSWDSLSQWRRLERQMSTHLYTETGMLWMGHQGDERTEATLKTLAKVGIPHERLGREELEKRFPQISFGPITWAVYEPQAGALFARRGVQTVSRLFQSRGGRVILGKAQAPSTKGRVKSIFVGSDEVAADQFVFACGPWLGKVFPDLLGDRIFTTRQAVFYLGPPSGDARFSPPQLPVWIDFGTEYYGIPDLETKGFKIAFDKHGPRFDPDSGERVPEAAEIAAMKAFVADRFPALKDAPVVAAEVCQYENSSNGDFLIDRHPDMPNVLLVGGGSGHGFKHGPAVGSFAADRVQKGDAPEPRFTLATKAKVQSRSVH